MIGMIFGLNSIILPCSVLELCQFKDFARLLDHPVHACILICGIPRLRLDVSIFATVSHACMHEQACMGSQCKAFNIPMRIGRI